MSASLVDLKNNETSAMEGVSIVWGAEIPVTAGGLGAFYYSLMTEFDGCNRTRGRAANAAVAAFSLNRGFNKALAKTLG
ncbi:hypothetical protein ACCT14_24050 [Rhizobium brockwellii]|jgi:hypothetical protein|uniref:Uncharacterized protein n=2 Tax=Rhizobium TaxID=379 RepID=A0ABU3YNA1_9HYPH|nr:MULTISPECIES: hypothetical protein [Rhizobium]MDV4157962.1 hypothetical protein [Rhizobium brockwellii]MDV4180394.1 hypothetical protein [Rhizobium brockwellii]MDV4187316.1 hypothetical protein [Rhizobium brockwellii]QIO52354.1 hypothetical protein HA461_14735 [Rhizobium leguminosarum bv. trifolii]QJX04661.1 hypothetical protein RLCC275e_06740 [Rhizobium brockwellii]